MSLRLDFCSRQAASFAVKAWHYSGCLPAGRMQTIGCWEGDGYRGCLIFSRGACKDLAARFGFSQVEAVELTRIALAPHQTPTTRIVAIALRLLKAANLGLQVVISFSDPAQSHNGRPHTGGIYRAGNWMFLGMTHAESLVRVGGELRHPRTIGSRYRTRSIPWLREHVDAAAERVIVPPKFRFAMPLTNEARERLLPHVQKFPKALVLERDRGADTGARGPQAGGVAPSTPAAGATREGMVEFQSGRSNSVKLRANRSRVTKIPEVAHVG